MNFKAFPINNRGSKKAKVKIDKKKYEFSYLTKGEYKHQVDEAEEQGTDIKLLGYTTLIPKSDAYIKKNKDNIVGLLTTDFSNVVTVSTIENDKKRLRYTKGYLYVGNNKYVAIRRFNPLIFLLFLLIGLFCLLTALGLFGRNTEPLVPWQPDLEEIVEVDYGSEKNIPQIQIAGFSSWHIPVGRTESIPISLKNPDNNPCYFSFDIYLKDTNEVLYTSKMVKPGDEIARININKALSSGKYTAVVHINTNELETGYAMNDASFEVDLTVS